MYSRNTYVCTYIYIYIYIYITDTYIHIYTYIHRCLHAQRLNTPSVLRGQLGYLFQGTAAHRAQQWNRTVPQRGEGSSAVRHVLESKSAGVWKVWNDENVMINWDTNKLGYIHFHIHIYICSFNDIFNNRKNWRLIEWKMIHGDFRDPNLRYLVYIYKAYIFQWYTVYIYIYTYIGVSPQNRALWYRTSIFGAWTFQWYV